MERPATAEQTPQISIIIVSDYAAGTEKSWEDLRRCLGAWADQDGAAAKEFLLVESSRFKRRVPSDARAIVRNMRVLYADAESSYELKNRAVETATGDWVAIVDADCRPQQTWLTALREAIARHPDASVISGKTLYPGRSLMERVLGLLSRSYLDPGGRGPTRFISGNAAAFRRAAYLRHPLPVRLGAFSSRIQSEAFLRDGEVLLFDPALVVVHDFEGWPMERDIRRNHGYSTVVTRLRDNRLPYAGLVRAGAGVIPLVVAGKIWNSIRDCFRCFHHYDVRWYEVPLAMLVSVVAHVLEAPGMLAAFRRQDVMNSQYR